MPRLVLPTKLDVCVSLLMPRENPPATWQARFLAPRHALAADADCTGWLVGRATTPAVDARLAIYLAPSANSRAPRVARFGAYGPPVLVACADWVCEYLEGLQEPLANVALGADGVDAPLWPPIDWFERALALAATDRFAVIAVQDAMTDIFSQCRNGSGHNHDSH